jgi:hypothetical protein
MELVGFENESFATGEEVRPTANDEIFTQCQEGEV